MKLIRVFLLATFFTSYLTFADGPLFDESLHVLKTGDLTPVSAGDCAWASPFLQQPAQGGYDFDLYTLQSKKTTGEILVDGLKKVGNVNACFGSGYPVTERGLPFGEVGIVWYLELNGQTYLVGGASRFRTNPPGFNPDFPEPGMYLSGASGTIVVPPAIFTPVGSMTSNGLGNEAGVEGYEDGTIVTIRLYSPSSDANGD